LARDVNFDQARELAGSGPDLRSCFGCRPCLPARSRRLPVGRARGQAWRIGSDQGARAAGPLPYPVSIPERVNGVTGLALKGYRHMPAARIEELS